jgi:hypothetical protein
MRSAWLVLAMLVAAGCASSPSAQPSGQARFAGSFGGNTFDTRAVGGRGVSLAHDPDGKWSGRIACRWRLGLPTGKMCPFYWEPRVKDGLPPAIGAPGVGAYEVTRSGHSVLLRGTDVEYQFVPKANLDLPTELIAPLFFAVATTTDPGRDLVFSDPPLGFNDFIRPSTRLVWVIPVEGLGEVAVRRAPASSAANLEYGSGATIFVGP